MLPYGVAGLVYMPITLHGNTAHDHSFSFFDIFQEGVSRPQRPPEMGTRETSIAFNLINGIRVRSFTICATKQAPVMFLVPNCGSRMIMNGQSMNHHCILVRRLAK